MPQEKPTLDYATPEPRRKRSSDAVLLILWLIGTGLLIVLGLMLWMLAR